jgi:hypothetical protein
MKTSELTGAALDWMVCVCEGESPSRYTRYSTDWAQGGPIIEEQEICINSQPLPAHPWVATIYGSAQASGSSPLIAAMRCYVASRLGDEVDVPDELLEVA